MDVLLSDIWTTNDDEVYVATDRDDGSVLVALNHHDGLAATPLFILMPDAAHELGNKLRLAAKKART